MCPLLETGFSAVQKSAFGDVASEVTIDGTEDWRTHESLYLKAFCPLQSRRSGLSESPSSAVHLLTRCGRRRGDLCEGASR